MKTIWKFPLVDGIAYFASRVPLELPRGARPLTVQMQRNTPTLWAEVDPSAPTERRTVYIEATGAELEHPSGVEYVSTFQASQGALVFHVFIDPPPLAPTDSARSLGGA